MKPNYSFQVPLVKEVYETLMEKDWCVLAAGCGAGKTNMAIEIIQQHLYDYPEQKVLVLAHGQIVLRDQFSERIEVMKLWRPFTHKRITKFDSKKFNAEVTITLPQTIHKTRKKIRRLGLLIIDEAHHYFFSDMVQDLIKRFKPKRILLLTGTPSEFIRRKEHPVICYGTDKLLDAGVIANPVIEMVVSDYRIRNSDLNKFYNVKSSVKFSSRASRRALKNVLHLLIKKLKGNKRFNIDARKRFQLFNDEFGKTLIACHNQDQARDIYGFLKEQGVSCLLSTSDDDAESVNVKKFHQDETKVLVVVVRGVLGFDMFKLANVIDMTGSHNPDRIFQLFSRVIRRNGNESKLFVKVTSRELVGLTYPIMNLTSALTQTEFLRMYDGNVARSSVPIKKSFLKQIEKTRRSKTKRTIGVMKIKLPKIITMIELKDKNLLNTYAYTTIRDVQHKLFSRFGGMQHGRWTFQECEAEAKKYDTRSAFKVGSAGAYQAALKNGWIDEICKHMKMGQKHKPMGYWTFQLCKAEAKKYDTRRAFKLGDLGAYCAALKNGWLDKICKHMKKRQWKHRGYWTFQLCKAEAKKYDTRRAFKLGDLGAYYAARRNGWTDKICKHMKMGRKPNDYWTFERCRAEAKKYNTKKAFNMNCAGAYGAAIRNGWLDKICKHMVSGRKCK